MLSLEFLTTRQLINTGLFVGDMCLVAILVIVLVPEMRRKGWFKHYYNKLAFWLAVHFLGLATIRFWSAVLLWTADWGRDAIRLENVYPLTIIGSIISFIGALGVLNVLAPETWRKRAAPWRTVVWLTIIGMVLTYLVFNVNVTETKEQERQRLSDEIHELLDTE